MKKFFTICLLAIAAMVTKSQAQISGSHSACLGSPVYLVDSSRSGSGGTWSLSSTSVATLSYSSSSYCMVTGISAGTVVVTFTSGSSTDTFSVTFAAGPAAIGGVPSVLCVGSTATLTDATTGGTWTSSNPSVASINASTGVVYGLSAGYAAITYSIGTACDATDYIYVSSGGADSIIGTSTICPGTTYYFFLSSGSTGTWSTSNASVASVDATTGMVTAVSTGTAIISCLSSGSCGSSASTFPVSVITTPTVTATGGTAFVGGTTTLTATPAGGYWSIGSTSVASIDPYYGTVTGIASGSAVVTYTYSGCGTASDTALVTVAPFGGISGWVRFNYGAYTGSVKVWLIKYSSGAGTLTAVDSFTTTSYYADSVYYQFPYASTDTFRVKAYAPDTTGRATGYMPTYHTSSYYWYSANVINHTSGTPDTYRDIDMAYGTATSGPGFVSGYVTAGANKGTAGEVPVANMRIYLVNQTTNTPVASTLTNASGVYSFSNIAAGTYKVFPEALGYITTPASSVNVSTSSSSFTFSFYQHTISKTITLIPAGVTNVVANENEVSVYPNPANNTLSVNVTVSGAEKAMVTLTDMTGRAIISKSVTLNAGAATTNFDVKAVANGVYFLNVRAAGFDRTDKIEIAH